MKIRTLADEFEFGVLGSQTGALVDTNPEVIC